jgi:hypothetical protein
MGGNACGEYVGREGHQLLGNQTRSRPNEKIERQSTADDAALKPSAKEPTGKDSNGRMYA